MPRIATEFDQPAARYVLQRNPRPKETAPIFRLCTQIMLQRDQNPLASYGNETLEKLKEIAGKYDPEGVFQTLQNGGWLLSMA